MPFGIVGRLNAVHGHVIISYRAFVQRENFFTVTRHENFAEHGSDVIALAQYCVQNFSSGHRANIS